MKLVEGFKFLSEYFSPVWPLLIATSLCPENLASSPVLIRQYGKMV